MTKEDKVLVIQDIKDLLQDAKNVYIANLEGMNALQTSNFRRLAFKGNITMKVVKNTLLQKAMESMEGVDYSEVYATLKGNTAVMTSEIANAPAKLMKDFRKKAEYPALKSAVLDSVVYVGDDQLETLANIKSKEEMIGEIIGLLQSPIRNVLSALQNKENASDKAEETTEEVATEAPATEEAAAPEASAETPAAE
ncbi:50S ribosomal protein L10 [Frigoriflavimonas asaccharolytica]|uniref:Large ribosomal subunit protein uL10 n=1 Tax=Frigoriflavimonas asaccharolytica TaxID=2735899 RepID=A0A8J8G9L2_9FLAO|nr:50S ribosomal protein L10 [Frigoriflavimonas asaccharolytica]NRS93185.1 large subunit ribosomal protein L10 [Frigoriflavimonas asaccharolytica]